MHQKSLRVLEFYKIRDNIKKYAKTSAAIDMIDMLEPYDNIYDVKEHMKETKEAVDLINEKGSAPFEGVYDVREVIGKASKGATLLPGQLLKVAQVVRCARRLKAFVYPEGSDERTVLQDICEPVIPLKSLEDRIFNAIISEDEMSDRASDTLYSIRRSLKTKNSSIKDKVNDLVRQYSSYLQENIYTVRGDRYVIPVKAEHKGAVKGLVHDMSSTGATLFIEPASLVALNNEIKELRLKEQKEIDRILMELSKLIHTDIDGVKRNADVVWELDFIFSKAAYSLSIEGICPEINEEGIVDLVKARHPMIPIKEVVANDIYLGRDFTSLVVTGPNTGGKTVTLKTLGLVQIMALSGLMIPADEGSIVSFFKNIYADIGDEQSIEQSLSTFSSHMTNIVGIIEDADEESLVLFDELGAGTDPTEGAGLAISILETLRKRKCRIAATTHYSELKGYALQTDNVENASVEFDVNTLRPTYKLLIGVPGKSNAFEISKRLGLPDFIIENAKENISSETLEFEELIQTLQEQKMSAERNARQAELLKLEAEKLKEQYKQKADKVTLSREKVMAEAQKEARELLKKTKAEADEILKNIRKMETMGYSSEARQKLEEERLRLKNKMDASTERLEKKEDKGEKLTSVSVGDEVLLTTINQKVTVLTKPNNKGEVEVQAGIMKVTVKLKDLRKSEGGGVSPKPKKTGGQKKSKLKLATVSSSVDLRGMDAEEALYTVDKYLDDAYLGGLNEVTIIHGKGTGVLRTAVTDMLRRHAHVKSYRLGEFGEGGSGVTVVVLK